MKNSIKVLIVDDDRSSSALISEVVKRMGFKPVIASKATDGLNVAKLQTVHAAVIDVMLPKMSGVDLAGEFRKTQFGENPIILVSGVFKDKAFAAEAIRKSGAVDFLFKPYAAEDLINSLKTALGSLLTVEKWNLQSLLTRGLNSVRERSKAIENLEPIKGHDFPFVLTLLMEAEISGHLNLVSDGGEIFGVTLSKGTISEVDSSESQSFGVLTLISKGFLAQEDWDAFEKNGKKKFPLERLVQVGLVSPHAVAVAKQEQIVSDFKTIVGCSELQLNFVRQDDGEEPPKHALTMKALMKILFSSMDEFFPESHLVSFYEPVIQSPMQLKRSSEDLGPLRSAIETGGTLASALERHPGQSAAIYNCLHYLVLSRSLAFDDAAMTQSMSRLLDRYTELFAKINGKAPIEIYEYFSGTDRPSIPACEKVYTAYLGSSHPDKLPKEATAEIRELAVKCFDIMTAANAVMTDEGKRAELFEGLKNEGAERIKKSNELVFKGLEVLRKGQPKQAIEHLKMAKETQASTLQFLILTWAEVKAKELTAKPQLLDRLKKLESLSNEEKKSTYYNMVLGLIKKGLGDPQAAACFERVLQIDSEFAEARRELNRVTHAKEKKIDILNGDLTDIVSQLFRRKAE